MGDHPGKCPVKKSSLVLCTLLLGTSYAWGQAVPGTYKIVSFDVQLDGAESVNPLGKALKGYVILTKSTFMIHDHGRQPQSGKDSGREGGLAGLDDRVHRALSGGG
jgi:hypothetical protein